MEELKILTAIPSAHSGPAGGPGLEPSYPMGRQLGGSLIFLRPRVSRPPAGKVEEFHGLEKEAWRSPGPVPLLSFWLPPELFFGPDHLRLVAPVQPEPIDQQLRLLIGSSLPLNPAAAAFRSALKN